MPSGGFGVFDEDQNNAEESVASPKQAEVKKEGAMETSTQVVSERYLVFCLGGLQYATPLMAAREVIEVPSFRSIPNTKNYFLGIANLRGEVVGLIDLRAKLGLPTDRSDRNSIIIYESESGALGAMIDEIKGVINLDSKDITRDVSIKTSVPQKFLTGVGKINEKDLVIVLDLKKILDEALAGNKK